MKVDGSCHCGAITYEAEIDPKGVYLCHCNDCQAISGSPFRWAVTIPAEAFRLLSGTPKTYVKTADSGNTNHQVFCPDCASPLYSTAASSGSRFFNLRLGTARQRAELQPQMELWCRSSPPWLARVGGTTCLEQQQGLND